MGVGMDDRANRDGLIINLNEAMTMIRISVRLFSILVLSGGGDEERDSFRAF
jgi:hypothetical protein